MIKMIDNEKFLIDMLHNVEELSELQKEVIKFARGKLRLRNMRKEINDVNIAVGNIQLWIAKFEEEKQNQLNLLNRDDFTCGDLKLDKKEGE
jgi:hypothetical protein